MGIVPGVHTTVAEETSLPCRRHVDELARDG